MLSPDHLRGALAREAVPPIPDRRKGRRSFEGVELWQLPGAGLFTSDPALCNTVGLIAEFRRQPAAALLRELVRSTDDPYSQLERERSGRPLMEGDWPSLFLGYVAKRDVAIQRFRHELPGSGLLEACGFDSLPSRQSIDLHFAALEKCSGAFEQVAQALIRHATQVDPRVGVSLFVDGTAFQSGSGLNHLCEDAAACARAGGNRAARLHRATPEEVKQQHFQESEEGELRVEEAISNASRTRGGIITLQTLRGPTQFREIFIKRGRGGVHRYLTRDLSSGVRWYENVGKFWLGGYLLSAVDAYTRLEVSISVFPADLMERDGYPQLAEGVVASLGAPPRMISVDRGFAPMSFHEYNARRGIAVVAPFKKRKPGEQLSNRRTDSFDEHGVPRCQFCGGPGDRHGVGLGPTFNSAGEPFIRFRCVVPRTHDCRLTQRLSCASDWVQLPLLSQDTALFHAVRHAHHNKEGNFDANRHRYALAGQEGLERLCRSGIDAQRLRCTAGLLLNWFRLSLRQGWLEPVELDVTRNPAEPLRLATLHEGVVGTDKLDDLLRYRDQECLELPYGRAAHRLREAYRGLR
jgi:hypothetical protein